MQWSFVMWVSFHFHVFTFEICYMLTNIYTTGLCFSVSFWHLTNFRLHIYWRWNDWFCWFYFNSGLCFVGIRNILTDIWTYRQCFSILFCGAPSSCWHTFRRSYPLSRDPHCCSRSFVLKICHLPNKILVFWRFLYFCSFSRCTSWIWV